MGQGRLDEQCGGRAGSPAFWAISGLAWADPWAAGVAPCPAWPQGLWLFRALPAPRAGRGPAAWLWLLGWCWC